MEKLTIQNGTDLLEVSKHPVEKKLLIKISEETAYSLDSGNGDEDQITYSEAGILLSLDQIKVLVDNLISYHYKLEQ